MKLSVLALAAVLSLGCREEFARWTKRSEGTVVLNAGMTLAEAQRQSTLKINPIGYSGYFDVVVAGESLRVQGCTAYYCSMDHDRIQSAYFHTEKETWPDVLRELRRADALLLAHGWKHDPQTRTVASLPTDPREAAAQVNHDTSIDRFRYLKGNRAFDLTASGLWDGIPWWRRAHHVKMFWRAMEVWTME